MATSTDNSTRLNARNRIQWAALQLGLFIVAMTAFVETIRASTTPSLDAARLSFAVAISAWFVGMAVQAWYLANPSDNEPKKGWFKTYSVPKRLGIGTLLVVLLPFGLWSAWSLWLSAPLGVVLAVLGIFIYIGVLQFLFDRTPRQVSALAGGIPFAAWPIGCWLLDELNFTSMGFSELAYTTACWGLGGALIGYIVGATIGSMFMCFASAHWLCRTCVGATSLNRDSAPPTAPAASD